MNMVTTREFNDIVTKMDAKVVTNLALYFSEDVWRMTTIPFEQILTISEAYNSKIICCYKFCIGFACAHAYWTICRKEAETPFILYTHKIETYDDFDRSMMDDCFREYINRRLRLIRAQKFLHQDFSKNIRQKCYVILYKQIKAELKELQKITNDKDSQDIDTIIMLVRRLLLVVEMELPMFPNPSKLKPIVNHKDWTSIEDIAEEISEHSSSPKELAQCIYNFQKEGMIQNLYPRLLMKAITDTIGPISVKLDSFTRNLNRKKSVKKT